MRDQICVYYVGGPWDQHKVVLFEPPKSGTLLVREVVDFKVGKDNGADLHFKDHEYYVREVSREGRVFVAVHEDLL